MSAASRLGPAQRDAAVARLRATGVSGGEPVDVLVVGGGAVGVGAALDAAARGLTVGLVEQHDLASGTSSRSSKLVHGGIRYLEQLDFTLVREALVERGLLMRRLAPHLVHPVRFLYPLRVPIIERLYVGAGMALYDLFSWTGGHRPGVEHHRHVTRRQLARVMPDLRHDTYSGGLVYADGQVDDARLVATIARTAARHGAEIATRVESLDFIVEEGAVVGIRARDGLSGEEFPVRARRVVSATGVWTNDVLRDIDGGEAVRVRASKGIHILVPRERFRSKVGLLLRTETSVLFVIPWGRHWIIGTTDTEWVHGKSDPVATADDVDYLLAHVNGVLTSPITRDDIEGVYAGLRPLLSGESDETSKLSREHVVARPRPGLVAIAGGKLTTYRVMAADVIDAAAIGLGDVPSSVTADLPLVGADGYAAARNRTRRMARDSGLAVAEVERLLTRYGTLVVDLIALIAARPELGEPLPGTDYLAAEAVYAVTHEGATRLEDVLERRTRITIEAQDRGVAAAPVAAALIAPELGWDAARTRREVTDYLEWVAAERASELEPDDASAERIRAAARETIDG